ncbi:MAG: DUF4405 domain-containing protein [Oscillospiraceae bacterium]|nr:DUF4405 domain-containing protein [Oscillospiraceae bacterium]
MKPKLTAKIIIDILMTLALLFLMGYQLWGDAAHEWVGAGMFLLFIAHHILNFNWHKNLFKNKYTARRIAVLCIDILVFADMLIMMFSGIVMSRHVFVFLPISGGVMLARRLHIIGSYWGILLMSLHLGMHVKMFAGMIKKRVKIPTPAVFVPSLTAAAYGVYAFIKRDFPTYMFLRSEFVFLDYDEPKILFYLDYISIMVMCIFVGHYFSKLFDGVK